jgi:hypothetical protein
MAHSPHKRWRGCCLMCAHDLGKVRGSGWNFRAPIRDQRKIGKVRRARRHDLGDHDPRGRTSR